MKIELLSFLEWTLQLSILLNIFMAGLCGFFIYQDRQKAARGDACGDRGGSNNVARFKMRA